MSTKIGATGAEFVEEADLEIIKLLGETKLSKLASSRKPAPPPLSPKSGRYAAARRPERGQLRAAPRATPGAQ